MITITCLNLAGGYAIAATVLAQQSATLLPDVLPDAGQQKVKKSVIDLQTIQLNKEDSEDEPLLPVLALIATSPEYSYIPDFKLLNKHFLLHYGTSIKDKELAAYILHQNFRL
ncbi:hypothetical protein [Pontibacter ruber]|uniref:hypothetical protein n=1 Tax=Pontibacter ruber TaxID=1343895 RepID=UPI002027A03F|nr:hypothetical protein [Pontibacter ruber]